MRFLRMLTNSLLAGALGAAYLTILILQLNPQVFYRLKSSFQMQIFVQRFYIQLVLQRIGAYPAIGNCFLPKVVLTAQQKA